MLTREQVLETFERHRSRPGAAFDESHFLDYLLVNPGARGAVRNSFEGLRRFNRFIDEMQFEVGICFSQADLEKSHSVESFVERVNALRASRRGSLASLKKQEQAGAGWRAVVAVDLLLGCVALGSWRTAAVSYTAIAAGVVLTAAFAVFAIRRRQGLARLRHRIEAGIP